MPLSAGSRLGPYEILSSIGAGGMGEVYRARDAKLKRDVAIKILPDALAADPAARARFEREAQTVAAQSHPNILGIFDFGVEGPTVFAVMELLEGGTLREALRDGPLTARKTVEYATQIAAGLGAAHASGITHRDLKPENIFVTRDGRIKLLDFGLAKAGTENAAASASMATSPALTGAGTIVGTVGYMAPEQVRGRGADHRSDIFSFGAILYELLSGQRAFSGDSAVETMNAILKEDPPELTRGSAALPPALDRIVRRCLEKNPEERFQSARDVAFALEAMSDTRSSSAALAPPPPARNRTRAAVMAAGAIVLIALTAGVSRQLWSRSAPPGLIGLRLSGPELAMAPSVSPDGNTLAFQTMVNDLTQVAVMKPESGSWTVLTNKRNAGWVMHIVWSADGNTIYFDREADVPKGIFSVSVLGGEERLVLENAMLPAMAPEGSLIAFRVNDQHHMQLFRFWPDSGRLQPLPIDMEPSRINTGARVFPDGKEAVVRGRLYPNGDGREHFFIIDLSSGQARRLVADDQSMTALIGVTVTPDNRSVIAAVSAGDATRVMRYSRDGRSPAESLLVLPNIVRGLDVAPDGSIYIDAVNQPTVVFHLPPNGGHAEKISALDKNTNAFAVLPDGRIVIGGTSGSRRILLAVAAGKDPVPLINTTEETADPVAPIGNTTLAFLIGRPGAWSIATANIANGRVEHRVAFDKGKIDSITASDSSTLYVSAGGTVWRVATAGGEPTKVRAGNSAVLDPTGRRLIVQVLEADRTRLFDVPLDGGAEREIMMSGEFRPTIEVLRPGALDRDGRLLVELVSADNYFYPPGFVDVKTGQVSRIPSDFAGDYHFITWAPDGRLIAMANEVRSTLWHFKPE